MRWRGFLISDEQGYFEYLEGPVRTRLLDAEATESFAEELRTIASSGMESDAIDKLIAARELPSEPWQVAEAFAECVLADEHVVTWPWHTDRDKRSPRASLPGADIVGFIDEGDGPLLLLGEVKVSGDESAPPGVLHGRNGMIHQIDVLLHDLSVQYSVLKWLRFRCASGVLFETYKLAVKRFLETRGKEMRIVGILVRDTLPSELDLLNRGKALAERVNSPTNVVLTAWYLPGALSTLLRAVAQNDVS